MMLYRILKYFSLIVRQGNVLHEVVIYFFWLQFVAQSMLHHFSEIVDEIQYK